MQRTQMIQGNVLEIDAELQRKIHDLAAARGINSAELVREAIRYYAPTTEPRPNWLDSAESFGLIGCKRPV